MAKIEWIELDDDLDLDGFVHPSELMCQCSQKEDNEYLLHVTEGTVSIEHAPCGKTIEDDGYIEIWSTVEPIPITARFVDLGMSASTPDGPAEHNGFWWELAPREQ